jgi:hypothetical protein
VETEDADSGMSKSVLYQFTEDCKLADCQVRDNQRFFGSRLIGPKTISSNFDTIYSRSLSVQPLAL